MRLIATILLLTTLSGCALFESTDVTPVVNCDKLQTEAFMNQTAALNHLVNDQKNGMSNEVRLLYQNGSKQNETKFQQATENSINACEAIGVVDIDAVLDRGMTIFEKIWSRFGGETNESSD